jgi:hypothetical protein
MKDETTMVIDLLYPAPFFLKPFKLFGAAKKKGETPGQTMGVYYFKRLL